MERTVNVELRKVDTENVWDLCRLKVTPEQENFVAPNLYSIAEAFAVRESGQVALPFGIYEDGAPVGFVMLGHGTAGDEDEPDVAAGNYCLWRFMIDARYQGRGLGRKALELVLEYIRTLPCGPAEFCWLSYEPENTGARALYRSLGFAENGETDGDEIVAILKL